MRYLFATILVAGAGLSACGGGGGGGGSGGGGSGSGGNPNQPSVAGTGVAPAAGPGDASGYFPVNVGSAWFYDETDSGTNVNTTTAQASTTVTGTKAEAGGVTASIFRQSSSAVGFASFDNFYAASGGGITFYGNDDPTDPITNQISPVPQLLFPLAVGPISSINASKLQLGTDSSGNPILTSFSQTATLEDFETLTILAGSFPNTARVVTTLSGTASDPATGQSIPISGLDTTWLAPGVGVVQETTSTTSNGTTTTKSVSARGYTLGGVQHGLGYPQQFGSTVELLNSAATLASNGSTLLWVGTGLGAVNVNASLSLLDCTGTVMSSASVAYPSAPLGQGSTQVVFDGTNYEVVQAPSYTPTNLTSPSLGGTIQMAVERVTPAGALLDGPSGYVASAAIGYGITLSATSALAGGANNVLAVVQSWDPGLLIGVLLSPNASAPTSFVIADATHVAPLVIGNYAAAAYDNVNGNYFVVWTNYPPAAASSLFGVRLSATGTVLDTTPIQIATNTLAQGTPSVAFDGSNFLVAWLDNRNGPNSPPLVYAARVQASDGAVLDGTPAQAGFQLSMDPSMTYESPKVAYNGSEYLVTWVRYQPTAAASTVLSGVRVSKQGQITSGPSYEIVFDSSGTALGLTPGLSLSPGCGLLTWYSSGSSSNGYQLNDMTVMPF